MSLSFFYVFKTCHLYFYFHWRRVEEWKCEYMWQLLFHPKNEISPLEWPAMLQDLMLLHAIGSESTQEMLTQAVEARRLSARK